MSTCVPNVTYCHASHWNHNMKCKPLKHLKDQITSSKYEESSIFEPKMRKKTNKKSTHSIYLTRTENIVVHMWIVKAFFAEATETITTKTMKCSFCWLGFCLFHFDFFFRWDFESWNIKWKIDRKCNIYYGEDSDIVRVFSIFHVRKRLVYQHKFVLCFCWFCSAIRLWCHTHNDIERECAS